MLLICLELDHEYSRPQYEDHADGQHVGALSHLPFIATESGYR